jgi:Uma2 family endonuclease
MATPVKARATYADLVALPENLVGEIIDGELYASPRPAGRHTLAASSLGADLGGPFQKGRGGPGGWWILDEPELHFGEDVVVPDLGGWRKERLARITNDAFFVLAPDWVCEVLSPSTERIDRVRKLAVYAREGVRHAWLLNPIARTLEVFRLEGQRWLLVATHGPDEVVRAEPFDAIEIDLLSLWGETRQP